jgi:hypothetical protein
MTPRGCVRWGSIAQASASATLSGHNQVTVFDAHGGVRWQLASNDITQLRAQ